MDYNPSQRPAVSDAAENYTTYSLHVFRYANHFRYSSNGSPQTLRAVPMEETDAVSIAQEIIYRNNLPQWRCLCVIIIFSFSLPTLSSSSNGSVARAPWKLVVSPQWRFHGFLVHWVKRRPDFFMRKPFLGFLLFFFINYVAMSAFCLRDKSFNEDRNHHQYTIGTALKHKTSKLSTIVGTPDEPAREQ